METKIGEFNMGTKIEWADSSINPIVGCTKCSPGCDHCYAEQMAWRQAHNPKTRKETREAYRKVVDDGRWNGRTVWRPQELEKVAKWNRPRRIFVCSMSDPFHETVPWEWIYQLNGFFREHPQHTFMLLTKRPWRAVKFQQAHAIMKWPRNVWMGTTVCNASEMGNIKILGEMNVAVKFISFEPMLGEIDLLPYLADIECVNCGWLGFDDNDMPEGGLQKMYKGDEGYDLWDEREDPDDDGWWVCPKCKLPEDSCNGITSRTYGKPGDFCGGTLDWVICGGETGPGARSMKMEWARKLRDQCSRGGVPFFFKGAGGVRKEEGHDLIDGKRWQEFPEVKK